MNYHETYTWKLPTELFMGIGAVAHTAEKVRELGGGKVVIVTDNGVYASGTVKAVEDSLQAGGIPYEIYHDVEPEPTYQGVEGATALVKESGASLVIGVGGGSALDTAKNVAVMAANPGSIFDYLGFGKVQNEPLPSIAIPTSSGTGSEATFWAVVADKEKDLKASVGGWNTMFNIAILDPQMTITLPPRPTAACGIDALTHAMESWVSKDTQPVSEALSYHAMKLIARSIRKATTCGDDLQAREDMLMGSLIAAMAFNVAHLGLVHAFAMPLGAKFKIPHGVVNSIMLPWVMEYNIVAAPEKYAEVAKLFGENVDGLPPVEAAAKAVDAVKKMMVDVGITDGLADYGVKEEDLLAIAEKAHNAPNTRSNPRSSTVQDQVNLLKKGLRGLK